jgi:phosphatidylserine decarboxylase
MNISTYLIKYPYTTHMVNTVLVFFFDILSFFVGFLSEIPIPNFLKLPLFNAYIKIYGVNTDEIKDDLKTFKTFNDFFTREIKERSLHRVVNSLQPHPLQSPRAVLVSPVDGELRNAGNIKDGELLQVKGKTYTLKKFLGDYELADIFKDGYFFNLYLSPKDYHHVHSPVNGCINSITYIPGALFPVNNFSAMHISDLFAQNERLIISLSSDFGEILLCMVGAANVGKISITFDRINFRPQNWPFKKAGRILKQYTTPIPITIGQKIGTFNLGSTVVIIMKESRYNNEVVNIERSEVKKRFSEESSNFSIQYGDILLGK